MGFAERARETVAAWLADQPDLPAQRTGEASWLLRVPGEQRRGMPVHLVVGDRTLTAEAFFMRAPDQGAEALYAYLLRRHLRSYVLRFALGPHGDVLLMGVLPLDAVDAEELDRLVGQLLSTADEAYAHALRTGFASYIAREQAWRERSGLPRNPITPSSVTDERGLR